MFKTSLTWVLVFKSQVWQKTKVARNILNFISYFGKILSSIQKFEDALNHFENLISYRFLISMRCSYDLGFLKLFGTWNVTGSIYPTHKPASTISNNDCLNFFYGIMTCSIAILPSLLCPKVFLEWRFYGTKSKTNMPLDRHLKIDNYATSLTAAQEL